MLVRIGMDWLRTESMYNGLNLSREICGSMYEVL